MSNTTVRKAPLTLERRYKLLGYIDLLTKARPHGGCIHAVKQELTVLVLVVGQNLDITDVYEERIKATVRRLYPIDQV